MDGIGRVSWVWPAILPILAGLMAPGCKQVAVIPAPGRRVATVVERWHPAGPCRSASDDGAAVSPGTGRPGPSPSSGRIRGAGAGIADGPDDPARLLALAELADQNGRAMGPFASDEAMAWSRDAAVYAAFCLSTPGGGPVADATACSARNVHNRAVARCLRRARTAETPGWSGWPDRLAAAGIMPAADVPEWTAMGFTSLEPAEDRLVTGMEPKGQYDGLGVPLIARRDLDDCGSQRMEAVRPRDGDIRRDGRDPAPRFGGRAGAAGPSR